MAEARISTRDGTWTFDLQPDGTATVLSFEKIESKPVRGLGDVVARTASAMGIKPCAGCQKRREALNRLVPFGTPETPQEPSEAPRSPETPSGDADHA